MVAGACANTGIRPISEIGGDIPGPVCTGEGIAKAPALQRSIVSGFPRGTGPRKTGEAAVREAPTRGQDRGARARAEVQYKIYGADISPRAVEIAEKNIKSAGVGRYIELQRRPISAWTEAPQPAGVLVTNPPYGERISAPDMDALYKTIGSQLKHVFTGYHAWIIGYRDEYFARIGLAPSEKIPLFNGSLECSLREYIIFDGDRKTFVRQGGKIGKGPRETARGERTDRGDRSERAERPSRPSRPSGRFDRGDRPERPARPVRGDRFERGDV